MTKRCQIDGVEIRYDDFGSGGERPLLLVHGFTGHREDFGPVREDLGRMRRCLVPDVRGHGDAHAPASGEPGYSFAQLADDIRAFLDALGVERCELLGHSMGGMVALRFVLAHPERVASLILMNTSPDVPGEMSREQMQKAGGFARAKGMAELQARVEAIAHERAAAGQDEPHLDRWAERYWAHHRRRYAEMDPRAYADLGLEMAEQASLVPRLSEIRCRTSVIVGEDDDAFLPATDRLLAGIRGARRSIIPNAGHHPHEENREAWLAALRAHLDADE